METRFENILAVDNCHFNSINREPIFRENIAARQIGQYPFPLINSDSLVEGIRSSEPTVIGFDAKLWNTTVDHVTVNRDDTLVFTMRDGREIRIKR